MPVFPIYTLVMSRFTFDPKLFLVPTTLALVPCPFYSIHTPLCPMLSSVVAAGQVAIFWDYENCSVPSNMSGYELVSRFRDLAHEYGGVKLFKAYTQFPDQSSPRSLVLRSELQSSGVSLTDCPHTGRKNVADQMIIADIFNFLLDNPNPYTTTIILVSGDRDYAYTLSILRLRMYRVVVIAPSLPGVHVSLKMQASVFLDWALITDSHRKIEKTMSYQRSTEPPGLLRSRSCNAPIFNSPTEKSPELTAQQTNRRRLDSTSNVAHNVSKIPRVGVFSPAQISQDCAIPQALEPIAERSLNITTSLPPDKHKYHHPNPTSAPKISYVASISAPTPLEPSPLTTVDTNSQVSESQGTSSSVSPPVSPSFVPAAHSTTPQNVIETVETNKAVLPRHAPNTQRASRPTLVVPPEFQRLVHTLENYRLGGQPYPLRSVIALELVTQDRCVYEKAGYPKFGPFAKRAEELGLVKLGGMQGSAWIALHYNLHGKLS
ncbi:hypothetical protein GYMLUDRAFT_650290 [Collybiopsis luxurians FD-317 M1]|uniref:NYN domain-containing protein n=1 Tax=Collybiopsis luxurians FD-317 M1 TaxID=944289 RepID=A0A0D0BVS5_9AGAR|nr:hypothetical protein GYMLUDRAFT_650290 [Collybiopsis luxurians FD-317 M1]